MPFNKFYLISACALSAIAAPAVAELKVETIPASAEQQTITVGSHIFQRLAMNMVVATVLTHSISVGDLKISPGEKLVRAKDKKSVKYCAGQYACLFDDDGDGKFDRTSRYHYTPETKLDPSVPYETKPVPDGSIYGLQEIKYVGSTAGSLRITYRETFKGLDRQNVYEELTIPLGQSFPQPVAIKNIKITILSIDGMGMRYRIEQ